MSSIPQLSEEVFRIGSMPSPHVNGALSNGNLTASGSQSAPLDDVPIENFRPIKVVVIGAGYSGINSAIRIPQRLRNVELTIYEKNSEIGGTWFENRYPGCACDIPAHSYQYSFSPNPRWSGFYAPAREICDYLQHVGKKFSADRFIKTNHKVTNCEWNSESAKWLLTVEDTANGRIFTDEAQILVSARGSLNDIAWPSIPGLSSFVGKVVHSAAWDNQYDFSHKRIGVIGGGSSAIQIVPQLQRLSGTTLSCFVRSKTWIAKPFGEALMKKLGLKDLKFSADQLARFAENSEFYHDFRKQVEQDANVIHDLTIRGSELQASARTLFANDMTARLAKKPEIAEKLLPNFAVGCRRLTPGTGYLEALVEDNVDFITTPIEKIVPNGLVLSDGTLVALDALVCATGFRTGKAPSFSIRGRDENVIKDRYEPHAESYLSLALDKFPNFFTLLGPNSLVGTGSLTMMIEAQVDYVIKCIRKVQRENIQTMEVKAEMVREFSEYVDTYFENTVYLDNCSSWYRSGDRISGLWPGSTLHALEALRAPRWEDFEYTYGRDGNGKPVSSFKWLGNGWSYPQRYGGDLAYYLEPEFLDIPASPFPEKTRKDQLRSFCY